jgi:hypothetical protein
MSFLPHQRFQNRRGFPPPNLTPGVPAPETNMLLTLPTARRACSAPPGSGLWLMNELSQGPLPPAVGHQPQQASP